MSACHFAWPAALQPWSDSTSYLRSSAANAFCARPRAAFGLVPPAISLLASRATEHARCTWYCSWVSRRVLASFRRAVSRPAPITVSHSVALVAVFGEVVAVNAGHAPLGDAVKLAVFGFWNAASHAATTCASTETRFPPTGTRFGFTHEAPPTNCATITPPESSSLADANADSVVPAGGVPLNAEKSAGTEHPGCGAAGGAASCRW